jgi:hypothetical protein
MPTHSNISSATAGSPSSAKRVHGPPSSTDAPTVLLTGPWQYAEFAAIRAELDLNAQWPVVPSLADAVEQLTTAPSPPNLIFLAQARPGVDRQEDVERVRQLAPLTRIVVVAGTWCEGELRTGRPLTGVVRLYWYELPAWWRANCRACGAGESPSWSSPLTGVRPGEVVAIREGEAPAEPRIADQRSARSEPRPPHFAHTLHNRRLLAIDCVDYSVFEALNAGLANYGWTCIWQPRHRPSLNLDPSGAPTAAIWDGGQLDKSELESLTQLCARMAAHSAPVIALLDFPRVEHLSMAKTTGVAVIFAKPYQLSFLNNELLSTLAIDELNQRQTLRPHKISSGSLPLEGRAGEGG